MPSKFIETQRLTLRKLEKTDVDLIVQLNSDPEVMKYIGAPDSSRINAIKYVNLRVDGYAEQEDLGLFVGKLKQTGVEIGWFCLKYIDGTKEIEIGFRLHKAFWGQGFATEGATALMEIGFTKLGLKEIVGIVLPENKASQQVLKKLGLKYIGPGNYNGFDLAYYKKMNKE